MNRSYKVCFIFYVLSVIFSLTQVVKTTEIECIPLKLCPMAMKLIKNRPYAPEVVGFLRYSHCGFDENGPKVWCVQFKSCLTPDSREGVCTKIRECGPYVDFMKTVDIKDPVVRKYLKEFRCSTEADPDIRVCCRDEKMFTDLLPPSNSVNERFSPSSPRTNLNEECGKQNADNRIFGGSETYLDEFPWMALLKYVNADNKTQFACGGALITKKYVLTAAHCVDPEVTRRKGVGDITNVVLGEYDIRNETDCIYSKYGKDCADPVQEFEINKIIMHPLFNATTMNHDIALIRLKGNAQYSDYVQPICVPTSSLRVKLNETLSISGWGRTETLKRSPIKMKTFVKLSPNNQCTEINGRTLSRGQICVGEGKGPDSCHGDSGGPLMLEQRTESGLLTFIAGIVSYGYGQMCGAFPGVYTYVPTYSDWINSVINES